MTALRRGGLFSKSWQIDAVGLGVLLVLTLLAYLVGVLPLARQAASNRTHKQQLAETSQQAARLNASRGALREQLEHAQQAVASGSFQLRNVKHLNRYLAQLTQLATASGLVLHEIQPGKAVRGEHYWSIPIEMSGAGRYRTSARFLHGLHKALPDTRLSALELSAASGNNRAPAANFRFNLIWYAVPEDISRAD